MLPKGWDRVELTASQVPDSERRFTHPDHFGLSDPRSVVGRHVVVLKDIEDTWVLGGHAQSAAATLLLAWRIDPEFRAAKLEFALKRMFEPLECSLEVCLVTGGDCPPQNPGSGSSPPH
ncbi:hypothetical protein GFY24_36295 [Nocardia sp. SYP-A9097]|uniref:hypothetical protein n=1 Tax=Nocardia sp. SYP-A9097 TaxID=2663237 RepID=UPI00129A6355|nr:hypothetical protein [Nocardia sp. SYP-A9097]MRH92820.1 hypothetical protein [Nocardia sp. SYP-A9097]